MAFGRVMLFLVLHCCVESRIVGFRIEEEVQEEDL